MNLHLSLLDKISLEKSLTW